MLNSMATMGIFIKFNLIYLALLTINILKEQIYRNPYVHTDFCRSLCDIVLVEKSLISVLVFAQVCLND